MTERVLRVRAERAMDRQQNRAERAEENYEASQLELKQQRLLLVDERERLEAVIVAHGATITDMRRRLDEVAARDPGAAADRLLGVLASGGVEAAEPGAAAATAVRTATDAALDAGRGGSRGPR
jgi:queuine/archaeosine tRNA-ribosyltransferase